MSVMSVDSGKFIEWKDDDGDWGFIRAYKDGNTLLSVKGDGDDAQVNISPGQGKKIAKALSR